MKVDEATSMPERVRAAVIALHERGVKPTPRNLYAELHYGRQAPHGVSGMRIINGKQGQVRVATMWELGWRKKRKTGVWEPPAGWPPEKPDEVERRVPPRARLGEEVEL